jgi:hypothetical protein
VQENVVKDGQTDNGYTVCVLIAEIQKYQMHKYFPYIKISGKAIYRNLVQTYRSKTNSKP